MSSLATVAELKARCDWTFDADEDRAALGYLEEASDLVRAYGRDSWDALTAPRMVKNLVIGAVRRFMRNPEGYTQSRAGDETLAWSDIGRDAASIFLTNAEIKLLRSLSGSGGIRSSQVIAWGTTSQVDIGTVPVAGYPGEKPFPYYNDPVEPW